MGTKTKKKRYVYQIVNRDDALKVCPEILYQDNSLEITREEKEILANRRCDCGAPRILDLVIRKVTFELVK